MTFHITFQTALTAMPCRFIPFSQIFIPSYIQSSILITAVVIVVSPELPTRLATRSPKCSEGGNPWEFLGNALPLWGFLLPWNLSNFSLYLQRPFSPLPAAPKVLFFPYTLVLIWSPREFFPLISESFKPVPNLLSTSSSNSFKSLQCTCSNTNF